MRLAKNQGRQATVMHKFISRSLWAIILIPILAVSAYSLYVVARYFGVPPIIAIAMSTCFDGVALLCANYSIRYAEQGLNGTVPRMAVRLFALLGAYVQTFHARIGGNSLSGSWILWASLPIAAVVVYEVHIRWAKREALIAANATFTAPRPEFGTLTWVMYPAETWNALRNVIGVRKDAITRHALASPQIVAAVEPVKRAAVLPPKTPNRSRPLHVADATDAANAAKANRSADKRAPVKHVRKWANSHGYDLGDRGRVPAQAHLDYLAAHGAG